MNYVRARILCVDDDPQTCEWIRSALRDSPVHADVVTSTRGIEGQRLLVNDKFDLCIVDYALPDMTGVQLCAGVRQLRCDVPIMFFTALSRPVDRERARNAGATEFLCKPDDFEIFPDAVEHLLNKRRKIFSEIYRARSRHPALARAA